MIYLFLLVFCLHVYLCDGFRSSGMGIADSCELPYGCLEMNPGYVEDTAPRKHLNPKQQIYTPICFQWSRTKNFSCRLGWWLSGLKHFLAGEMFLHLGALALFQRSRFNSKHPRGGSQPSVTPGNPTPSSGFKRYQSRMCKQAKHPCMFVFIGAGCSGVHL